MPGSLALILALLAFVLGPAPFTPVLAFLLLALPLALFSGCMGAWRLALMSLYFSMAICLVVLPGTSLAIRVDHLLLLHGIIGVVLGAGLLYFYRRTLLIA